MPVIADQGRIHSLPTVLASQIAAGEVIERPASVVKELLENSLDAGATRIQIDIEAAGSRLIRVRDDGGGIHPEDLSLALAPHSTSKIRTADDLAAIYSLGFRGEALASIAAVARLTVTSRHVGFPAMELAAAPDRPVPEPVPAAHPAGTTLEVRDLFFNMPARRKFLRSEQTEFLQISELVKSFALARTGLGLRLTHNGRAVFTVSPASSLRDRITQVFGDAFSDHACVVEEGDAGMSLHGAAGQATTARSQADRQYLFLNGRLIRDRRLNHALRSAYAEVLPPGRYAPFLLYLEMNAADYDINVHPTKHEVRFRAGRDVHDFLYSALRRSLAANRPLDGWQPQTASPAESRHEHSGSGVRENPGMLYTASLPGASPAAEKQEKDDRFGRLLGCVLDRYLLTETSDALLIIDGRAVVERLTLLDLEQAWHEGTLASRPLLLPETRTTGAAGIRRVEAMQESLAGLGVRLDVSSPTQIALRELPLPVPRVDAGPLLEALLGNLPVGGSATAAEMRAEVFSVLAREAGRQYRPGKEGREPESLLERLSAALAQDRLQPPWPWKPLDAEAVAAWLETHD